MNWGDCPECSGRFPAKQLFSAYKQKRGIIIFIKMKSIALTSDHFFACFDPADDPETALYVTIIEKISIAPHETYPCPEGYPEKYIQKGEQGRILNEYQFIFISEGMGRLRSFEGEFILRPGCLVCLVPGEKCRYGPDPESPWAEYRIGFSGSIPDEWAAKGWLDKIITVHQIVNPNDMIVPFKEAVTFSRNQSCALRPLAASCVMRIFGYLLENRKIRDESTGIIQRARHVFEKNIFHPIDMDELTMILNSNYQQLRDRFREETGLSPYQYFLQMKINKAKELLQEGSLSIKEIAYKLAFESPYYFSRLFKRKTGVSPSQWNNTSSERDLDLWPEK